MYFHANKQGVYIGVTGLTKGLATPSRCNQESCGQRQGWKTPRTSWFCGAS